MTQIKQDTEKVHLLGEGGVALCEAQRVESAVKVGDWLAGYTPATLGSRICRACEEKAGTGAELTGSEQQEREGWKAIDA